MQRVHLDHNATTPLRPEARAAWLAAVDELGGNPSSQHAAGRLARHRLDEARERVAAALGVGEDDVVFTSGGTESNNLAILGAVRARGAGAELATAAIEHPSVLGPAQRLQREGHELHVVPVDTAARVDPDEVARVLSSGRTALVSIALANGEVGTLQPLAEIGELARRAPGQPLVHADMVQALGRVEFHLREWNVALASFSAHKVGGPAGVGVLVRRAGVALEPLAYGGTHEGGLRPGTENVAAIAAAAVAIELAVREREAGAERLRALERALWEGVRATGLSARLLGPPLGAHAERLPGTLNLLFAGVDGRVLVARLDRAGLEASAGSACASGSLEPSPVLRAMQLDDDDARAGLRLSLGRTTAQHDVAQAVEILRRTLGDARAS